jgi:hypothetical protein
LLAWFLPFALALTANSAQAQDLPRLAPTSDWEIGTQGDSCLLLRRFGEGDQAVQLHLRTYEPEGRFFVQVFGALAQPSSTAERIRIGFSDVERMSVPYLSATVEGQPALLLRAVFSLGPLAKDAERRMKNHLPVLSYAEPDVEARIDSIGFHDGLAQEFVLETGSLREPMEALRQCGRELTSGWEVTAEERQSLSRIAVPKGDWPWIRSAAFQQYIRQLLLGRLLLIVGEEGRATDCHLMADIPPADADAACAVALGNARFEPALDAGGQPAKDYFLLTFQPN